MATIAPSARTPPMHMVYHEPRSMTDTKTAFTEFLNPVKGERRKILVMGTVVLHADPAHD